MFKEDILKELNYTLSDDQLKRFDTYYKLLVDYNKHTNLTRITNEEDVYIKHFLDSLLLTKLIDFKTIEKVCDMGAGAGFPSVPVLITYPHLRVTIVESQIKRVQFLNELIKALGLDVDIVHERAEVYAKTHQETFDLVTARALGELNIILEYGIPMLKENGYFIAPKGSKYEEERENAMYALKTLKSSVIKVDTLELPSDLGFRANLLIQKKQHVENYPRAYPTILKKPL